MRRRASPAGRPSWLPGSVPDCNRRPAFAEFIQDRRARLHRIQMSRCHVANPMLRPCDSQGRMPITTKSKPRMRKGAKMKMQQIRCESDYDPALETINGLMGAAPGNREADALEALVDLVEANEAAHWRKEAPDPGL